MLKNFTALCALAFALALGASAAVLTPVEASRTHAAAGAFGCTITGATNANPIVVTCAAAHGFVDGDQVQVTGVVGNTNANTLAYVKVTSYSATTFGMFSDVNLTVGIAGNAAYTSGGSVTMAYDVSSITGDFTLRLRIESLASNKRALVSVQESADGFVADIRTLLVFSTIGQLGGANGNTVDSTVRAYQIPLNRFGVSNARVRLFVQAADSGAALVSSFYVVF